MKWWLAALGLLGCAPSSKEELAAERLRTALARLPTCVVGKEAGSVQLFGACTALQCEAQTCCNTCDVREVRLLNANGPRPVEIGRAREVLDIGETLLDCEATAVRDTLSKVTMIFDPMACVVRE